MASADQRSQRASVVICLLTIAALGFCARAASAQTVDPWKDARIRFGGFYFSPTLTVDQVGVDTNVFDESGQPKSDFTFRVEPRGTAWFPVARRALFTTKLGTGYTHYQTFSNQRSLNGDISLRGDIFLRRLTLFGEGGASSTRDRPSLEIDTRVRHAGRSAQVGFRFDVSRRLSVELAGYRTTTTYAADASFLGASLADTLDRAEQGLRLIVRHRLTSLTTIGLKAEDQQLRFSRAPSRDADGFRIAPLIEMGAKALVSGTAEVGFRRFTPRSPGTPTFNGLVASLALSTKIAGATQLRANWDRDLGYSYQTDLPYYLSNRVAGSVRRQLFGKYDAIIGVDRTSYAYRTIVATPSANAPTEVTTAYTVDVGYRVNKQSRIGFAVSRWIRASNLTSALNYATMRAGLSFNYGF